MSKQDNGTTDAEQDSPDDDDSSDFVEGFTEIETGFNQQLRAFQRRRDGLVLSLEEGTVSAIEGRYAVTFLPQNFRDDDRPISRFGDDGYLIKTDDQEEALDAARDWMEENPQ